MTLRKPAILALSAAALLAVGCTPGPVYKRPAVNVPQAYRAPIGVNSTPASAPATAASLGAEQWTAVFEGTDACVAPVLSMAEAPFHPHNVARSTFVDRDGAPHPAPAPRFSSTGRPGPSEAPLLGGHTDEILHGLGYGAARITALRGDGVVA